MLEKSYILTLHAFTQLPSRHFFAQFFPPRPESSLFLSLSSTKNDSKLVAAPVLLFVFFFLVMCATISNPQYCSFVFATV